jgi:hypothetical protein
MEHLGADCDTDTFGCICYDDTENTCLTIEVNVTNITPAIFPINGISFVVEAIEH